MIWIKKNEAFLSVIVATLSLFFTLIIFGFTDFFYSSNTGTALFNRENAMGKSYPYGWYGLKNKFNGDAVWGNEKFSVYTDQYGYRVSGKDQMDRALNRDADIIFLGDSFTYGGAQSWSETYVGLFEAASGKKIINAGVYSYSPTAYLYQYQQALKLNLLKPGHTVVVAIDISDIQDEAAYRTDGLDHPINMLYYKDSGLERANRLEYLREELKSFKNNHLVLTNKILDLVRRGGGGIFPAPQSEQDIYDLPRSAFTWHDWSKLNKKIVTINQSTGDGYAPLGIEGGLKKTQDKFIAIAKLAKKTNSRVFILAYPWPAQLKYRDKFSWSNFLNSLCQSASCDGVIDTIPTFRELASCNLDWYRRYYVSGDIHLNLDGNKVLADALLKKL
jgi:hypothetical protein